MENKILEILADVCGVEPTDLEPDIHLFDEGLLDSFGTISLLVNIETKLGIKIEPTEVSRDEICTPQKLIDYVTKRG